MPLVKLPGECKGCGACCFNLMVTLVPEDRVPAGGFIEMGESGGWEMKQREDGSCIALNRETMLCMIYEDRPMACREFNPEDNQLCLDHVYARQQIVMGDAAQGVEAFLNAAADFAMSRGFVPTMRPVYWTDGTKVTTYISPTLVAPDIRTRILDESLLRMRGALSVVTQVREVSQLRALHDWAVQRKHAETAHRPDENIHKRTLVGTWDQVIRRLESLLPEEVEDA